MSKPSASNPRAGSSQTLLSERAHLFDIRVNLQVAADFPVSLSSDDIRDEKVSKQNEFPKYFLHGRCFFGSEFNPQVKVVRSIRPINLQDCVLGQLVYNLLICCQFSIFAAQLKNAGTGNQPMANCRPTSTTRPFLPDL
jgi:hypothetical protein